MLACRVVTRRVLLIVVAMCALAARGESLAAFDGRCIPAGCVAPPSNTLGILGRRALPAGRLARLGATPDSHHGLLGAWGGQIRRSGTVLIPSEPVADDRLDRLEYWLKAIDRHIPGTDDDAVLGVAGWSNPQLRWLWIDTNVITQLIRNPKLVRFTVRTEGGGTASAIPYGPDQLRRLRVLACAAAGGLVSDSPCQAVAAGNATDPELRLLAAHAAEARQRHDVNYVLRRGALLHTDAVLLGPAAPAEPLSGAAAAMPQRIRMQILDGQDLGIRQSPVHWEIARMLLDYVQPPDMDRPAPSKDDMVRQWYRATAAWMQQVAEHETLHLDRGRGLFPSDADLAFLAACEHETFASPAIQVAMRTTTAPVGFSFTIGNDRTELKEAETLFRSALALRPEFPEAKVRLGRVLGLLGRHEDAAKELVHAQAVVDDPLLQYFVALFLGAEEEALGRYDSAREAYERAAAIEPMAQSPWLALSQLARRRGDRASALRALQQMFDLPSIEPERDDPWWQYHVLQARDATDLLGAVRRPFLPETRQ